MRLSLVSNGNEVGTTVVVKAPFHALPVRLKDMEKNRTREFNKTIKKLQTYALAHPSVRISYANSAPPRPVTTVFSTTGSGRLKDVLVCLFGAKQANSMAEVSADASALKCKQSFICQPL